VLGFVLRDDDRIRRLWLLRVQVAKGRPVLPAQEVLAAAQLSRHSRYGLWRARGIDAACGKGNGICCDWCGSIQEWNVSAEALVDLIERMRGEGMRKIYRDMVRGRT
jgi:hypothetical protein